MSASDGAHAADAILHGVGGRENVTRLTHCFVPLRFRLRDAAAADIDALGSHPLVAFTVWQADELHVAPRRELFQLFEDVRDALGDIATPLTRPRGCYVVASRLGHRRASRGLLASPMWRATYAFAAGASRIFITVIAPSSQSALTVRCSGLQSELTVKGGMLWASGTNNATPRGPGSWTRRWSH